MKLFQTIDEKFAEIGFKKIKEDRYGASYKRKATKHSRIQYLNLVRRLNGEWLVYSCKKAVNADENSAAGLTPYEIKLALKKIKKLEQEADSDMACYL